jgi:hypothetical protein
MEKTSTMLLTILLTIAATLAAEAIACPSNAALRPWHVDEGTTIVVSALVERSGNVTMTINAQDDRGEIPIDAMKITHSAISCMKAEKVELIGDKTNTISTYWSAPRPTDNTFQITPVSGRQRLPTMECTTNGATITCK